MQIMRFARGITIVVVILALVAVSVSGVYRLVRPEGTTDFDGFYTFGRAVVEERGIYEEKAGRRYPPTFALFMALFALLPYRAAGILFIGLANLALIVLVYAASRLAYCSSDTAKDFKPGWNSRTVVPCLLASMFIAGNIFLGQVNLLVLALGTIGLLWAAEGKTLRAVPAIALAIALKVTPVLFLVYFLVKRRFGLFLLTVG